MTCGNGRGSSSAVLLIDDEASVRLPLRLSLEHQGYRVFEAGDGQEGLEMVERHGDEIALVVVDHQMPRMSGAEVVRELRQRPRHLPIILMSGLSSADTGNGAAMPDAFLRKPFELVELARTVRHLIGQGDAAA